MCIAESLNLSLSISALVSADLTASIALHTAWLICNFGALGKSFEEVFLEVFDVILGQLSVKLSDGFSEKKLVEL